MSSTTASPVKARVRRSSAASVTRSRTSTNGTENAAAPADTSDDSTGANELLDAELDGTACTAESAPLPDEATSEAPTVDALMRALKANTTGAGIRSHQRGLLRFRNSFTAHAFLEWAARANNVPDGVARELLRAMEVRLAACRSRRSLAACAPHPPAPRAQSV